MIDFGTMYGEHIKVISDPGDPFKEECQLRVVDGEMTLEVTGKSAWYDYIQSHKDSVDIHKILERCKQLDDYSILNRMPAEFMDTVDYPKNLAEAFASIQDARNYFDQLPLEIKQKYDQNFLDFISDIGSEKFNSVVGEFVRSIKDTETRVDNSEVKE